MKVSYSVVSGGDLAGHLHFRVVADSDFDPDAALQQIIDYPTTQPTLVIIHEQPQAMGLEQFIANLRERFNCIIVLSTWDQTPTRLWYMVDRVLLKAFIDEYTGVPATEVHLQWNTLCEEYPIPAPGRDTHIYAWTARDDYDKLIEWARQAPYPVGILTRPV